jgi:hypothetical protein
MAVQITGGSSTSGKANVTSTYDLQVRTPTVEANAGFATMSSEVDAGVVTGSRTLRAPESSPDYRFRVGVDQTLFNMSFEGTTIATDRLNQVLSTYTATQATGFLTLNAGASAAAGHAVLTTRRSFPLFGTFPTYIEMWAREANVTATNGLSEWGVGYAATTAAPTDAILFRRMSTGQLRGVVNFATTEVALDITTTNVPGFDGVGSYDATENNHYLIVVHNDSVEFWINDVLCLTIPTPATQPGPTQTSTLPIVMRCFATSGSSAARQLSVGFINVSLGDMNTGKPWAHAICGAGGGSYQTQPGTATGPTVLRTAAANGWPASTTAKTSGTWTATSAPATSELGGRWLTPAISTLTSEADYPVFAYLNPQGTNALGGRTLYITGIRVGECVAQAAASTNAIMLLFAAAVGSTAAATTTADAATTVAPRIVPLGSAAFLSTAVIGTSTPGFEVRFDSPLVVPPGAYWHFIVRPVGTVASNTLTVHGTVTVNGYFE